MARGKTRVWRSMLVNQAGLVWALASEGTDASSLQTFIDTGSFERAERKKAINYDPKVLQAIQDSGLYFGKG